jgi:hypothetical protein
MFRYIIVIFLLAPSAAFAQLLISKTKNEIKKEIEKIHAAKDNISLILTETDSSMSYASKETQDNKPGYFFHFDSTGKCNLQKILTTSDSCHQASLMQLLAEKEYEWKQLNMNQYISKFTAGVFLEMQSINEVYSITIMKTNLSKEMYQFLMGNK